MIFYGVSLITLNEFDSIFGKKLVKLEINAQVNKDFNEVNRLVLLGFIIVNSSSTIFYQTIIEYIFCYLDKKEEEKLRK